MHIYPQCISLRPVRKGPWSWACSLLHCASQPRQKESEKTRRDTQSVAQARRRLRSPSLLGCPFTVAPVNMQMWWVAVPTFFHAGTLVASLGAPRSERLDPVWQPAGRGLIQSMRCFLSEELSLAAVSLVIPFFPLHPAPNAFASGSHCQSLALFLSCCSWWVRGARRSRLGCAPAAFWTKLCAGFPQPSCLNMPSPLQHACRDLATGRERAALFHATKERQSRKSLQPSTWYYTA